MFRRYLKKPAAIILLGVGVIIAALGYIDKPIQWLGMGKISKSNEAYLKDSFDKSVTGFLVLSGIKSGLAVIEGSEVGVGFNLEVGDVVQSVYDYVDIAWQTALLGGTVILLTLLLLRSADMIDHWSLALLLFSVFASYGINWLVPRFARTSQLIRETIFYLIVFTVTLYLIVPFSITGAAYLSEKITRPIIEESHKSFDNIKEDFSLENINQRLFADEKNKKEGSWISEFNLKAKWSRINDRIKQLSNYFKDKTKNIAIWTIQLIAGYLFDSIVFPVTFFILLFVVTKSILLYLFEDRKRQSVKEDIAAMIGKYYGTREKKSIYRSFRLRLTRGRRKLPPPRSTLDTDGD
jgi:ABC-type multidrug transport system fused ATPase/permease subunit